MQAQQAIRHRQQSFSNVVAIVATVIAAALAIALLFTANRPAAATPGFLVQHEVGGEQIAHNRSDSGLGGVSSVGGEQVAHDRSEEGLGDS